MDTTQNYALVLSGDGMTYEIHDSKCSHLTKGSFADEPWLYEGMTSAEAVIEDWKSHLAEDQQGFHYKILGCAKTAPEETEGEWIDKYEMPYAGDDYDY